jgi:hypothetical protein
VVSIAHAVLSGLRSIIVGEIQFAAANTPKVRVRGSKCCYSRLSMAIPQNLSRDHVLQAIARLKSNGVPANAGSTKYDIVAPDGER